MVDYLDRKSEPSLAVWKAETLVEPTGVIKVAQLEFSKESQLGK
jgi:hypothetical protein